MTAADEPWRPASVRRRRARACVCILLVAAWVGACGDGGKAVRREFELSVRGGALAAEQRLIRVRQGDDVILHWSTDEPVTIHLHGYEIERDLRPGTPTTVWFVARATGRFPITRRRRGEEHALGHLEVYPR